MFQYCYTEIAKQISFFNSVKEDYLYNFSWTINKPLIGPHMLQLILTTKCNLQCKMCGVWKANEEELETHYVKKIIDDAYKMGNLQEVYFTGGEVLLRPDIFSLIKYVKDYYPRVHTFLNTNGLLLTEKNVDRIIDAGLDTLGISIDSPDPRVHNSLRGEGVFERLVEAINYINAEKKRRNKKNPTLNTCSVLMDQTLDTMYDMIDFCLKNDFCTLYIQPYVCNSDLRDNKEDRFWIKGERLSALRGVLEKIENRRKELPEYIHISCEKIYNYFSSPVYVDKCYSGFCRALLVGKKINFVCNGPNDRVYQHFGMADRDSLDRVWFCEEADFFRSTIKSCKNNCVQFCSIRPSSDSLADIHQRLVSRNDLFLVLREIEFLEEYANKYRNLPLKDLIDSDYRIIRESAQAFDSVKHILNSNDYPDGQAKRYLAADAESVNAMLAKEKSNI